MGGAGLLESVSTGVRGQKINANFVCTKFFDNPSGHGHPRRKSWTSAPKSAFSCGPGGGRNFLTPGHPGVRVRNVRGKSGPESLCLCCFSSLRSLVRTGVCRGFRNRPRTFKTAKRRRKSWKRALLFSAPNSGMHHTLVQKRSEGLRQRTCAAVFSLIKRQF